MLAPRIPCERAAVGSPAAGFGRLPVTQSLSTGLRRRTVSADACAPHSMRACRGWVACGGFRSPAGDPITLDGFTPPNGECRCLRPAFHASVLRLGRLRRVSVACRRPSYFSLLAQRKVAQRNGLDEPAGTTSPLCRGAWINGAPPDLRCGHPAPLGNRGTGCRTTCGWVVGGCVRQLDVPECTAPLLLLRFPSGRGVAVSAPLEAASWQGKAQSCTLFPFPGLIQAVSFGSLSLGQQSKETRWPAGQRNPP